MSSESTVFHRIRLGTLRVGQEDQPAYLARTKPHLAIVNKKEWAEVFPDRAAHELIGNLIATFADAKLEPATFDEWIEACPGQKKSATA